jgi:PTS hybrid protein
MAGPDTEVASPAAPDPVTARATLVNRDGLHARPASEFVKLASGFDATVLVNGVDAKSLLRIMSLGLAGGQDVNLVAEGPDARAAVDALVNLIDSAFGEEKRLG